MKIQNSFRKIAGYFRVRFKNLRAIFVFAMSAILLVAIVFISVFMFQIMRNLVEENAATNAKQIVTQTTDTINSHVKNMSVITQSICEGFQYIQTDDNMRDYLDKSLEMGTDIVSITMYNEDGSVYSYAPSSSELKRGISFANQYWYDKPADNMFNFSTPHVQNLFAGEYPWVITLYTSITINGEKYIMTIDMNFSTIDDYCSKVNIGQRGYIYLIDKDGNIIYHPQQQLLYANIKNEDIQSIKSKDDGQYIYDRNIVHVVDSLDNVEWKAVGVSYLDDSQGTINEIMYFMLIVFAIIFIAILVISTVIARYISRPIGRIIDTMEKAQENQFSDFVEEESYVEVQKLSNSYNSMTTKIQELMEQIKQEQRELRKTEIRALQAQINPHFLYNTLDSILWMCEKGDNQGASEMVSALGNLFRVSLSKGKEIISLREELSHAENYLSIQKVRYKDQFDYEFTVEESLLDWSVPKIILQPFLENAIYHGFGRTVEKGFIQVNIFEKDNKIMIEIKDNGVGITEELVEKMNAGENVTKSKSGIGVANVNGRLQMYFGKDYGVIIHSEPDQGTTVEISLPASTEEDEESD